MKGLPEAENKRTVSVKPQPKALMSNTLVGVWLILYGALALLTTKVPDWVVPVSAIIVGLVVLSGGSWFKRN